MSDRASERLHYRLWALVPLLFLCVTVIPCHTQNRDVLCSKGGGKFEAEFHTGVKLRVGAARNAEGGLATRACDATLSWDRQELVVATKAAELDVDVFGADLGVGMPVVALQVKESDAECCMAYEIYSLQKPPRLLRTITGGDFFSASDRDLDGRVEIWTADAAAVDGFEHLALSELDLAPTVVLRFDRSRLVDVSSEFQPYFDQQITKLRAELNPQDLHDFKNSDGKLTSTSSLPVQELHRLRVVKIKVIEVVRAYLYSDREPEAWRSLTEMWPASDVERIRGAILNARAHGIHAQVDATSSGAPAGRKKRAVVFDTISQSRGSKPEVIPAQAIQLRRPAPSASEQSLPDSELLFNLLIDSAGKVRSVEPAGSTKSPDADLIRAAMEWTFIPALKDGRAVASRLRLAVSTKR
ncbi:MAG TPA: hypothetical protein VNX26_01220 [Candidatus Acidoferrum sp.]|nr:hypothetical protein [Candidatus Acidoferrum sp.]